MPKDTAASSSFSQSVYTRSQRKKLGGDAQRVPSQTSGKSTSVSELFSSTHLPSTTANKDSKDKKLNQAQERNTHAPNHVSFTEVNWSPMWKHAPFGFWNLTIHLKSNHNPLSLFIALMGRFFDGVKKHGRQKTNKPYIYIPHPLRYYLHHQYDSFLFTIGEFSMYMMVNMRVWNPNIF